MIIIIPPPPPKGSHRATDITSLQHILFKHQNNKSDFDQSNRVIRHVCGYPVPDFQRDSVWTPEQQVRFIESVWLDLPIGTYTYHSPDWENDDVATPKVMSGWLIDGQQRLTAIEKYLTNQLNVFGGTWDDLNAQQKGRFLRSPFHCYEVTAFDEPAIRDMYNRMNFGGTAHQNYERA